MRPSGSALATIIAVSLVAAQARGSDSALAYRLENLSNELELLVRNHRTDESEVRRQERQLSLAHAFERVPQDDRIPELLRDLRRLGDAQGVRVLGIEVLRRAQPPNRIPREVYSDQTGFRLKVEDVVETIGVRIVTVGKTDAVEKWAADWKKSIVRLIEVPDGQAGFRSFPDGRGHRTIDAQIYRFRPVRFPHVRPRDPMQLLPLSARRDPVAFGRAEPQLWKYVVRIRELAPRAEGLYATRGQFFVNDARMTFLLSKLNLDY